MSHKRFQSNHIIYNYTTPSIKNLDFNGALLRISSDVESLNSFLEFETVSNKWFEVDQSTSDQPNGFWILVRVSVLEFDIYLIRTEVHEWELKFR